MFALLLSSNSGQLCSVRTPPSVLGQFWRAVDKHWTYSWAKAVPHLPITVTPASFCNEFGLDVAAYVEFYSCSQDWFLSCCRNSRYWRPISALLLSLTTFSEQSIKKSAIVIYKERRRKRTMQSHCYGCEGLFGGENTKIMRTISTANLILNENSVELSCMAAIIKRCGRDLQEIQYKI